MFAKENRLFIQNRKREKDFSCHLFVENVYLCTQHIKRSIIVANMKICIFCSANQAIDPDFFLLTEELGQWAAKKGHSIVFGGVNQGLMECVAKAAHDAGGRTIGIVPQIIERNGRLSQFVDVEIPCDNLNDRKQLMQDQSDVFIALPGGIGTLDEIFTIAASATIGYHQKPVILYNMKGFWDSLIQMLDNLYAKGVIRNQWRTYIKVVSSLGELEELLES